jgi:signal transduction histidine kinase
VDVTDREWIIRHKDSQHDEHHLIERVEPILGIISGLVPSLPQPQSDQIADCLAKVQTVVREVKGIGQTLRYQFRQPVRDTGSLPWDKLQRCELAVGSWFAETPWLIMDTEIDVRSHFQLSGQPFWANLHGVLAALRNLQTNAVQAVEFKDKPPYRIVFSAKIRRLEGDQDDRANPEYVVLSVADSGNGIPLGLRDRLFRARIADCHDACGLGSLIVRRVMDDHHGLIRLATCNRVGTLIELWFPRLDEPVSQPLHDPWEPYRAIRERIGPVCWIDEIHLLAALNDNTAHPDPR